MRVGLYLDLRNPPQWRRPWAQFYGGVLDRIEEAERLGIESVWLTEHHFFEDGYLPQPMTFAAAIAARTHRMRIASAIMVAALRPAVDVAEQAAIVDILSGGRLELGLGAGYRLREFAAFGADATKRYELLEQRAAEVRRLWRDGGVTPGPVQDHPPIWIGGRGPRAARIAGRLGEGLLWLGADLLGPYVEALRSAGHAPDSARLAGCANLILADDPEAAWVRIKPHLAYQWESYRRYGAEGTEPSKSAAVAQLSDGVDAADLRSPGPAMSPPFFDVVTPEEAIARLRTWLAALPVVDVFFWDSIAGMPDDLVERHIELLATKLAPALADLGRSP
jgi:alkanesulfonate monooxygenase SsuD/methylene tetrahydromethanopterin reductase-like flavin-dependent oxidoreductase (luciferase family)